MTFTPAIRRRCVRDQGARALQPGRGVAAFNIVPGLVGTILTMTMLIFTALSVTREDRAAEPWRACCRCRSSRSR